MNLVFLNTEKFVDIQLNNEKTYILDFNGNSENLYFKNLSKYNIEKINFLEEFENSKEELKKDYLEWIYNFPLQQISDTTILKYMKFDDNYSLWWSTKLAEKNPLKSDSLFRSLKLIKTVDIINQLKIKKIYILSDKQDISITLQNFAQKNSIQYINKIKTKHKFNLKSFFLKSTLLSSIYFLSREIKHTLTAKKMLKHFNNTEDINSILTYYPNIDKEGYQKGNFISKYWGKELHHLFEKDSVNHILFYTAKKELSYKQFIEDLIMYKTNNPKNNYISIEQFNKIYDLFKLFAKIAFFTKKYKILFDSKLFLMPNKNINLFEIHKDDWQESISGRSLVLALIWLYKYNKVFKNLKTSNSLFYLLEMQGWEGIVNHTYHKNCSTKSYGVVHVTLKTMMLNYFNKPETYQLINFSYPLPNIIACNGKKSKEFFSSQGLNNLKEVEANRYSYLAETDTTKRDIKNNTALITTSINFKESQELLMKFSQAYNKCKKKFTKIIIKPHPNLNVKEIIDNIKDFPQYEQVNTSINILLKNVSVVITTNSSSVLVESLFNNIQTITLISLNSLNMAAIEKHTLLTIAKDIDTFSKALDQPITKNENNHKENFLFLNKKFSLWKKLISQIN